MQAHVIKKMERLITSLTTAHLVELGTIAGGPGLIIDAIKSGNIFDPQHMELAIKHRDEWEEGVKLLQPYVERQKKFDEEDEKLRQMGLRQCALGDGYIISPVKYAHLEAHVPKRFGLTTLRIVVEGEESMDMMLSPRHDDSIHDALLTATRCIPRFRAYVCDELVFEHGFMPSLSTP